MKLLPLTISFCISLFMFNSVHAHTVSGVELREIVPATSERPELTLNGAALRELYLLIKSYVGALYVENPSDNAITLLESDTHKRMAFHVMMKRVSARRIGNALQEAMVLNLNEQEHKALSKDLDQMLSMFEGKMHKGELATFDYLPGKGTRITINGEVKGVIPGKAYFDAMLSMWVGENPVGRTFKDDILGANMPTHRGQLADN
jgi:hypothetical protein